ncbi:MAG: efflux RND transporter periplasmic adaptor subunit, partial [Anaerolineales bacterium]|nr:efflux RND transporter periplasmic adaptor subunit [Anaerolineales bacterium]
MVNFRFNKDHIWSYTFSVAFILLVLGFFLFGGDSDKNVQTVISERGTVIDEVSLTGIVTPVNKVNLSFGVAGKVAQINTDVGAGVSPQEVLARLDQGELLAKLNQARADYDAADSLLRKLKEGTRPEELKVQETKVNNASIDVVSKKQKLVDAMKASYTIADKVVNNDVDVFFQSPATLYASLLFVTDIQSKTDLINARDGIEDTLENWEDAVGGLTTDANFVALTPIMRSNLNEVKDLLARASTALKNGIASTDVSQGTLDGWESDVATARASVDTELSDLSTAQENLNKAESALRLTEDELVLLQAGPTAEELVNQEAIVRSKSALINLYESQFNNSTIRSPLVGTVTERNVEVGETVTANTIAFSVISRSGFEIEANIPEVDIVDINQNDNASVTLDAYGEDVVFDIIVSDINPAETIIDGVSTYKTTLQFVEPDDRIRSGMTANIDIVTATKEDVVFIPHRAVLSQGDKKVIRIIEDDEIITREVSVGVRGSDGNTEIVEGLEEGEEV